MIDIKRFIYAKDAEIICGTWYQVQTDDAIIEICFRPLTKDQDIKGILLRDFSGMPVDDYRGSLERLILDGINSGERLGFIREGFSFSIETDVLETKE